MKSNYCFIESYQKLKVGSFIYKVTVGISHRDQTKLALLSQYSRDCGCYLRLWSDEVLADIDAAEKRFLSQENDYSRPFRRELISIHQLYRMIVDGSLSLYEASRPTNHFQLWITFRNNPAYIKLQNKKQSNTACLASQRKNLSHGGLDKGLKKAI